MPPAIPIIEANVGVVPEGSRTSVSDMMEVTPTPTPTTAVRRGSPSAAVSRR